MKYSTILILLAFVAFICVSQCQQPSQTLFDINTSSNTLSATTFGSKVSNSTKISVNGKIVAVVQGNFKTLENKYVVYLDSNQEFNIGYMDVETGVISQLFTYQIPTFLTLNSFVASSFSYDVISQRVFCLAVYNTKVYMVTLNVQSNAQVVDTGMISTTNVVSGSLDPVTLTYYIMTVAKNQYVVSTFNTENQNISSPTALKGKWFVYSDYQSSIVAFGSNVFIVQLFPPGNSYVFQVVLNDPLPKTVQLANINYQANYYSTLASTINSQYIYFAASGAGILNSVLTAYALDGSIVSTVQLPYALNTNDIIFAQ
ncbi:hypothetical protein CYY_007309 [Polysphondylium violaceum]|uniref:Uncharacterized protein n=1 Tax=Polysphondylium violaceum TaxID=133409 RepID=A0A8J4V502_9MYCE|nr:hypothetical protein CYY_007309 [Polysphondylium violaceum]